MKHDCDFSGYVTKNDVICIDDRVIRKDAFAHQDGTVVPLVWSHQHGSAGNLIGKVYLENRPDGVYGYGSFNKNPQANYAKEGLAHGDIDSMSIWANQLKQIGHDVIHGTIREVSLVLSGANDGARIDSLYFAHGADDEEDEALMFFYDSIELAHSADGEDKKKEKEEPEKKDEPEQKEPETEEKKPGEESEESGKKKTVQDVVDTMNEEQKLVFYSTLGAALKKDTSEENSKEEKSEMKHNVFETAAKDGEEVFLSHDAMDVIFRDARKGTLKDSVLAHSAEYGIDHIDYLFPDAQTMQNAPEFVKRKDDWVATVMNGVHHTPFSRVKSMYADITADEARAKGYTKGNRKMEEVITLLKRTTEPTTIYKKQKLDRDDILDITDFDVVAWLKTEMRLMLNEEIARAILISDGRSSASEDKIPEDHVRPIWTDDSFYSIKKVLTFTAADDADARAKAIIKEAIKARKDYRGSGNPVLYTTEDWLTEMLLLEDSIGHALYKTEAELATKLRVSKIVTVPVMENQTRTVGAATHNLIGIIVNMNDYNVGADKGGAVNMFDDFDIDFNQQKYLMETRCSGALTKWASAIVLEYKETT